MIKFACYALALGLRTELDNLAASEPERLKAMIQTWNDMTSTVLHAPAKASLTSFV